MTDDTQRADFQKRADDNKYAIGQNADGTFNTFPASELPARLAAQQMEDRAFEAALAENFPDDQDDDEIDLDDLDDLDEIFGASQQD